MKLSHLTAIAALAAGSLSLSAVAGPISLAHWTFEQSIPTTAGPYAAELGLNATSSFASAFHVSTATVYSNPAGNGSNESYSSNNWTAGDYYQFTTSTEGYENITVQWDQTRSATGPANFVLQWSLDGTNFSDLLTYEVAAITWSTNPASYQPGSTFAAVALPAAAADQSIIYIRLTSLDTTAAAGTNRVDDIIISGTLIPAPGALALLAVAGIVGVRRRRNG